SLCPCRLRVTVFPSTTLFRSDPGGARRGIGLLQQVEQPPRIAVGIADQGGQRGLVDLQVRQCPRQRAAGELAELLVPQRLEHMEDRKSTRLNSSHVKISYPVF